MIPCVKGVVLSFLFIVQKLNIRYKKMGEISDVFQKMFIAGLEGVSTSMEKAKEATDELVKKTKASEEAGGNFVEDAIEKGAELGKEIEAKVSDMANEAMKKWSLASVKELAALQKEIDELKERVKTLEGSEENSEEEKKASANDAESKS